MTREQAKAFDKLKLSEQVNHICEVLKITDEKQKLLIRRLSTNAYCEGTKSNQKIIHELYNLTPK